MTKEKERMSMVIKVPKHAVSTGKGCEKSWECLGEDPLMVVNWLIMIGPFVLPLGFLTTDDETSNSPTSSTAQWGFFFKHKNGAVQNCMLAGTGQNQRLAGI